MIRERETTGTLLGALLAGAPITPGAFGRLHGDMPATDPLYGDPADLDYDHRSPVEAEPEPRAPTADEATAARIDRNRRLGLPILASEDMADDRTDAQRERLAMALRNVLGEAPEDAIDTAETGRGRPLA